jgi:hypothetical protein
VFGFPASGSTWSVVRARKRRIVSGTAIASSATHQATAAMTGRCSGHAAPSGVAVGLPNSVQTAAMTALIGVPLGERLQTVGEPRRRHERVREERQRELGSWPRCSTNGASIVHRGLRRLTTPAAC